MKALSLLLQRTAIAAALLCVCTSAPAQSKPATTVASTPPMGWNSWDSYGLSITAEEWKSNALWLHTHLQPAGWNYAVVDEGWYLQHPENAGGKGDQGYVVDAHGEYQPADSRFPDGLAGLASYAHGLGLKFGIHIIRGIPKLAVDGNLPIAGTALHAKDAADTADVCQWNPDNYGIRDNAAGQAYYDGLLKLYASWGVDFLKVDCISKPYNEHEIHMIRTAMDRAGRAMVLSLSPGPTPLAKGADAAHEANMWRISDDVWDVWSDPALTPGTFPQTIRNQFALLAAWMPFQQAGHWPDADMLAIGTLGPRPGWGSSRQSRLSADETRTLLTLWSIARSPLILGANLTKIDPATEAMLTNREVIEADQHGANPRQVRAQNDTVVWRSDAPGGGTYIGLFNLRDAPGNVELQWNEAGLAAGPHAVRDLWASRDRGARNSLSMTLPAHGAALLLVK